MVEKLEGEISKISVKDSLQDKEKENLILGKFKKSDLEIEELEALIENVEEIKNIFYNNYSSERNSILKNKILTTIKILDKYLSNINSLKKPDMCFIYYCKSFILDKLPEYTKEAEDSANKSLKLNPFNPESYNCIGHIIWKKGDVDLALNYFKQALQINKKDKETLRNLSMILRAKKGENKEQKRNICLESVKYAKESVDIDIKDGYSWCKFN